MSVMSPDPTWYALCQEKEHNLAGTGSSPSIKVTKLPPMTILKPADEPIEVIAVTGLVPPYNSGGPVVEITLRNVSDKPVTSVTATLSGVGPSLVVFSFGDLALGRIITKQ